MTDSDSDITLKKNKIEKSERSYKSNASFIFSDFSIIFNGMFF